MKSHASFNRFYRHIWSQITQSWKVAPETAKRSGKGGGARRKLASVAGAVASIALSGAFSFSHAQQAPPPKQLPTGGTVLKGAATITQSTTANSAVMNVNQSTQRSVINWSTFNLGQNSTVNFNQPSASSVTLNQINSANPSQVYGSINSNGQVYLSNANGMYFSPTASANVGALVATTHKLDPDAFMAGGNLTLNRNGATGSIINEGNLKANLGGYIALLAPEVQNNGVIIAQAGTVALAAGEAITLNFDGNNGLAGITTTPSTIAALVENKHAVLAPDGQIILSAIALNKLQAGVINNTGILEASSMVSKGGKIVLEGDEITLVLGQFGQLPC